MADRARGKKETDFGSGCLALTGKFIYPVPVPFLQQYLNIFGIPTWTEDNQFSRNPLGLTVRLGLLRHLVLQIK